MILAHQGPVGGISACSGDGGGIQAVRYPWVAATIGALPRPGTAAFTKGSTGGITVQAGQGLRPEPQGEAAHRGGQGTGQQAREPSQGQGVRTALHEEALAPSLASADAVVSSAMLIAHNPGIQDLALVLAAGGPALAGLREKVPTGALATLELDVERWRDLDHGTATATTLVTPRSLESVVEA